MRFRSIGPVLLVVPFLCLVTGCAPETDRTDPALELSAPLQRLMDSVIADDDSIHGAALAVISPSAAIDWQGAAGLADPLSGAAMTPANPVRLASNTKTFVAAAALRLVEDGRIDLDAPISQHLTNEFIALLESDGYDTGEITIRHLITHTSGLFDHSETAAYTEMILADPNRRWTPFEQVALALETGDPHAPPGVVYSYCDTGYVLLGLILEETSGMPLARATRELVGFESLGLESTWWEILEPAPRGVADRAHQYYGDLDVSDFEPHFDLYGGGGIVATVGDLATFFGGLFRGKVFHRPDTIHVMLSTLPGISARHDAGEGALPPGAYRMGLWILETDELTTYQHTGFWGTMAAHIPELDLTIAATVNQNQSKPVFDRIIREVIAAVQTATATPASRQAVASQ
jgi:D-alanyl-D-alanine carboxypeptidase